MITRVVLILIGGSSAYVAMPQLEQWLVQWGILPVLCSGTFVKGGLENFASELLAFTTSGATVSCSQRFYKYQMVVTSIATSLGFTSLTGFISVRDYYNRAFDYVKVMLFGGTKLEIEEAQKKLLEKLKDLELPEQKKIEDYHVNNYIATKMIESSLKKKGGRYRNKSKKTGRRKGRHSRKLLGGVNHETPLSTLAEVAGMTDVAKEQLKDRLGAANFRDSANAERKKTGDTIERMLAKTPNPNAAQKKRILKEALGPIQKKALRTETLRAPPPSPETKPPRK